ncbi:hypothetical protein WI23_13895 [Burkholderia oklahomensis C6786]|nr:hypothetical protein WI23_13895 [Burkholderia oklahomensis C6786]KUY62958.1 hypothetical protein WI23_08790 [Burkholderia oklahomensis C6786]
MPRPAAAVARSPGARGRARRAYADRDARRMTPGHAVRDRTRTRCAAHDRKRKASRAACRKHRKPRHAQCAIKNAGDEPAFF